MKYDKQEYQQAGSRDLTDEQRNSYIAGVVKDREGHLEEAARWDRLAADAYLVADEGRWEDRLDANAYLVAAEEADRRRANAAHCDDELARVAPSRKAPRSRGSKREAR